MVIKDKISIYREKLCLKKCPPDQQQLLMSDLWAKRISIL